MEKELEKMHSTMKTIKWLLIAVLWIFSLIITPLIYYVINLPETVRETVSEALLIYEIP